MYKYDLHVHTKEGSACGRSTGAEMAEMYAREGYTGFVVTDHFYTGNTAVPRDLPWEEWVDRFCEGYRSAKRRGDELGLDVFFGWEFGLGGGTEFLTLGDWQNFIDYMAKMKVNSITIGVYGCWGVQYDSRRMEYLYVPIRKYAQLKTEKNIKYYANKWTKDHTIQL